MRTIVQIVVSAEIIMVAVIIILAIKAILNAITN